MWEEPWPEHDGEPTLSTDTVLVAVVPRSEDWERVCAEGWYRIPLARAPHRLAAQYLAFYHTEACGELRWSIRYYAPIRSYALVTRRDLLPEESDHPRANDLYYKIEIGPLEALPRPIPAAKLRRITFISTTMHRLLRAREINDLWVPRHPRDRLLGLLRTGEAPPRRAYPSTTAPCPV